MPSPVLRSIFCQISCLLIPAALVGSTATAQAVTPQSGTRLFNGWSVTPAGTIIALDHLDVLVQDPDFVKPAGGMTSDLPLKMVVAPDGKALLAACAGFNNTGLAVIEMAGKKVVSSFPNHDCGTAWPSAVMARGFSSPAATPARFSSLLIRMAGLRQARQSSRPPTNAGHSWRASPYIPAPAACTWPTRPITKFGWSIPRVWPARRRSPPGCTRIPASSAPMESISMSLTGAAAA